MPWKCPACETQMAHDGDHPEHQRVYRCHVCRLDLVRDESTQNLTMRAFTFEQNRRETDDKTD
jgi:transposase-like protein